MDDVPSQFSHTDSQWRRKPKNSVGVDLIKKRIEADATNMEMMLNKRREADSHLQDIKSNGGMSQKSGFPKTTNQDFHNLEPFYKAFAKTDTMDKQNNKRVNVYASYVNAMFNNGVFNNPWQDQC